MGGARNLKLGRRGGKSQGTGGNNFFMYGPSVDLIRLLCASKDVAGSCLSLVMGSGGGEAPEAKTLLTFGRAMEATIFACRLIFGNAKKLTYVCVILQK